MIRKEPRSFANSYGWIPARQDLYMPHIISYVELMDERVVYPDVAGFECTNGVMKTNGDHVSAKCTSSTNGVKLTTHPVEFRHNIRGGQSYKYKAIVSSSNFDANCNVKVDCYTPGGTLLDTIYFVHDIFVPQDPTRLTGLITLPVHTNYLIFTYEYSSDFAINDSISIYTMSFYMLD